jgi:hypothetical protein
VNPAGNRASGSSATFKYDATSPTVTASPDRAADKNGWYNHAVTVSFSGVDATSGGVACAAAKVYSGPDSATASVSGSCTDAAGNVGTGTLKFKYDATSPTITITVPANGGTYTLKAAVASSYSCADGTSTVAAGGCTGPVANKANIDTSSVGSKSFTVTATDVAGNTATKTVTYSVTYSTSKGRTVLPPLEQVNSPSGLTKKYKLGRTLPIKFQLYDAKGSPVGTAKATLSLVKVSNGVDLKIPIVVLDSGSSNDNTNIFRYDPTGQQYIYNLSTKNLSQGTYKIVITLDDKTQIITYFELSN